MKVRSDFVTNSSSSSFILGFKNANTFDKEIYKYDFLKKDDLDQIIFDCKRRIESSGFRTIDEMIEDYDWYFKDISEWEADEFYVNKHNLRWANQKEWENDKELVTLRDSIYNEIIGRVRERAKGKSVFIDVEYYDHCDERDIAYSVMPKLKDIVVYMIDGH